MLRLKFAFALIALVAALSVATPQAAAQETYRATFDLAVQTHWGAAVLEPGEYTVTLEKSSTGTVFVHINGNNTHATILAGPADLSSKPATLTLVNVNGAYAVRKFDAGITGLSYEFRTPKGVREGKESVIAMR